jgi:hypothetical protein
MVDKFMKIKGHEYLHKTLGIAIKKVIKTKECCEIDPSRIESSDSIKKSRKRLTKIIEMFWESINQSAPHCPAELITIFSYIRDTVGLKFPQGDSHYLAISGFVFLRFFCAAILTPKLFGFMNEVPDPVTARTFTLIAKILQSLANFAEFGEKEPYMHEMNWFIKKNVKEMKSFLDMISVTFENHSFDLDYALGSPYNIQNSFY